MLTDKTDETHQAGSASAAMSPPATDLDEVEVSENAMIVLRKRYLRKNDEGEIVETPAGMLRRVARAIAQPEYIHGDDETAQAVEDDFYGVMSRLEFVPNSPTLMNAGTGAGTLSACFVIGLDDSMDSIMTSAKEAAMVQKYGGGTGFALSKIRPKGSAIKTTHGKACGPVAVLRHLSSVSTLVTQGGKRDGANMAVMDVHHPDIMEFITAKHEEGLIHNFNISVGASHEFMEAVKAGADYDLRDPESGETVARVDAAEVFDKIIDGAWRNGEPGLIFLDSVNADNPTPHLGRMTATNPCGEQPLLPYESCNLGSINLGKFLLEVDGTLTVDYERLGEVARVATRFLDNVIDANSHSVEKIKQMTNSTRKIGIGVMGFADMLARMRVPYDSQEGLELGRNVMRFIRDEADKMSMELAQVRGAFPAFKGSVYDEPGQPGMRNACRLTVAPTGTISMIAGCSSGIEPLFALCYHKHNILGGESLLYVDEGFARAAWDGGFYSEELMEFLADGGSLQDRDDVPGWAKRAFVTSADISPKMHVQMQAVFQESVDSAISKTINFPNSATDGDVRGAYMLAWELGCKGITVYRAGSRDEEVLTVGEGGKDNVEQTAPAPAAEVQHLVPRERPVTISGVTERVRTGHGNMYVTINFDQKGEPFEVFTTLGKSGGCDSAQLEAISRLVSLALRSGIDPNKILEDLRGITCCPAWDGGTLVRSAPDGVALALSRHLRDVAGPAREPEATTAPLFALAEAHDEANGSNGSNGQGSINGVRCPDCSVGTLVHQEGCMRCPECGYNKCE